VKALHGFRDFILRGNVVDLAVGVVIGAAFGDLVKSMVADVITPLIAFIVSLAGGKGGKAEFAAFEIPYTTIKIGNFLNSLLSFLAIAVVVYFAVVLPMNRLLNYFKSPDVEKEVPLTKDQQLLIEIRDALKARPIA